MGGSPTRRRAGKPGIVGFLVAWVLALVATALLAPSVSAAGLQDALLKVYATQLRLDYGAPWKAGTPHSVSGSAFVIPGGHILTNAHVVANATFIQLRRYGDSERIPARVVYVSHDADLALLTVDEPGFFETTTPLPLGPLPELQQEVLVLGFPTGGDTLSVTRGVVSRIEDQVYAHSGRDLLAGQIDSAVNPGNSGGPVLADGRVVGVVMQAASGDGIAFMIPTPVVEHFLADVEDGRYDGVPETSFRWQRLEAEGLRRKYALPRSRTGVLVLDAHPGSAAARILRPGDVLLSVDGQAVGSDGTIELRPRERTSFSYLLQRRQVGEEVELELLRDGEVLPASLVLDRRLGSGRLVQGPLYDERPQYFIFGGLVFCPLTVNYLKAWGDEWWNRAPRHLQVLLNRSATFEGEQAVVLCGVLRAELNSGYEESAEALIVEADGRPVRSFRQLVEIVESRDMGSLVLQTQDGKQIVIDRERARRDDPAILDQYQVATDRSQDLPARPPPSAAARLTTAIGPPASHGRGAAKPD